MALVYPSKTGCSNVLLIDNSVPDYQLFASSVNDSTFPIIYSNSSSRVELLAALRANFTSIDRIGIAFIAGAMFLDDEPFFISDTISDNAAFIMSVIADFNVANIDYLACNTLNDPAWVMYYGTLTGVIVGASNDATGNIKYGGDWVMESTGQDIEFIYFTTSIEYYKYLLDGSSQHVIAIRNDNSVYGTGANASYQMRSTSNTNITTLTALPITAGKTVQYVATGMAHSIFLMTDTTLYGLGYNQYGQLGNNANTSTALNDSMVQMQFTTSPPVGFSVASVACGSYHTMVLMTDGTLYATGLNSNGTNTWGRLGVNTTNNYNKLTQTILSSSITSSNVTTSIVAWPTRDPKYIMQVACGVQFTAFTINNAIYVAGYNEGQFGNLHPSPAWYPYFSLAQHPAPTSTISMIACGSNYTMVLMTNGTLYGAGNNYGYQMGLPNASYTTFTSITLSLTAGYVSTAIMCGANYTIILATNATGNTLLYGAGFNSYGQLGGAVNVNASASAFTAFAALNNTPRYISCSESTTYVLMTDGTLWGTGLGTSSQLGGSSSVNGLTQMSTGYKCISNMPGYTPGDSDFFIAIRKDNSVYGTTTNLTAITALRISVGKTVQYVATGSNYSIFLMTDGTLYGKGHNEYGQLGNNTNMSTDLNGSMVQMQFTTPPVGVSVASVACGAYHTMVLMTDGTLYGTGDNQYGQLGVNTTNSYNTLTKAITSSAWPSFTSNIIQVACGDRFTAFTINNVIYVAGTNDQNQFGNTYGITLKYNVFTLLPLLTTGTIKMIACGPSNFMYLTNHLTEVYGAGYNTNGQLGITPQTPQSTVFQIISPPFAVGYTSTAIQCGNNYTVILATNATGNTLLYSAGSNSYGQLGNGSQASYTTFKVTSDLTKTPQYISCIFKTTYVLMTDGSIWGAGSGESGQLGGTLAINVNLIQMDTNYKCIANMRGYTYNGGTYGYNGPISGFNAKNGFTINGGNNSNANVIGGNLANVGGQLNINNLTNTNCTTLRANPSSATSFDIIAPSSGTINLGDPTLVNNVNIPNGALIIGSASSSYSFTTRITQFIDSANNLSVNVMPYVGTSTYSGTVNLGSASASMNLNLAGSITAGGLTIGSGITNQWTSVGALTASTITAGTGLTVTSGGLTVTAGGLTVTAGGLTVTGTTSVAALTATGLITAGSVNVFGTVTCYHDTLTGSYGKVGFISDLQINSVAYQVYSIYSSPSATMLIGSLTNKCGAHILGDLIIASSSDNVNLTTGPILRKGNADSGNLAIILANNKTAYIGNDAVLTTQNNLMITNGYICVNSGAIAPYTTSPGQMYASGQITSGTSFNVSSAKKYKENIEPFPDTYNLDMLMKYKPVSFTLKNDDKRYPGLIAEDVDELGAGLFIDYDASGNPNSLDYARINIHLIKCIQELNQKIDKQQQMIDKQQQMIL